MLNNDSSEQLNIKILLQGKTLSEVCPLHLKEKWERLKKKYNAFLKTFKIVSIDPNKTDISKYIPQKFLSEYNLTKDKIENHVFLNYEKPHNYDYLKDLSQLTNDISTKKINLNVNKLLKTDINLNSKKNILKNNYIRYDFFGTKTGRLKTQKDSFPILTLNKKYRDIIEPTNDVFIEFDYNAAELRVVLGLLDIEQPQEDLHEWNKRIIYNDKISREEAKKNIFSWLYNPNFFDERLEIVYDRKKILDKYYDSEYIRSSFGDKIKTDNYHALNYLIQSTTARLVLEKAIKINKLLNEKKSYISAVIHDSVLIDFSTNEENVLKDIVEIFTNTMFGKFKTKVSIGKNFGEMNKKYML